MKTTLITLVAGLTLLSACGNDETDFQSTAVKTIVNEWKKQFSEDLTTECDKPASTEVGTTFSCTGTAPDGTVHSFEAEITKKDEVSITLSD